MTQTLGKSRIATKLGDLVNRDYDWSKDVAGIKAPTLIVFAYNIFSSPALATTVTPFLDAPVAAKHK